MASLFAFALASFFIAVTIVPAIKLYQYSGVAFIGFIAAVAIATLILSFPASRIREVGRVQWYAFRVFVSVLVLGVLVGTYHRITPLQNLVGVVSSGASIGTNQLAQKGQKHFLKDGAIVYYDDFKAMKKTSGMVEVMPDPDAGTVKKGQQILQRIMLPDANGKHVSGEYVWAAVEDINAKDPVFRIVFRSLFWAGILIIVLATLWFFVPKVRTWYVFAPASVSSPATVKAVATTSLGSTVAGWRFPWRAFVVIFILLTILWILSITYLGPPLPSGRSPILEAPPEVLWSWFFNLVGLTFVVLLGWLLVSYVWRRTKIIGHIFIVLGIIAFIAWADYYFYDSRRIAVRPSQPVQAQTQPKKAPPAPAPTPKPQAKAAQQSAPKPNASSRVVQQTTCVFQPPQGSFRGFKGKIVDAQGNALPAGKYRIVFPRKVVFSKCEGTVIINGRDISRKAPFVLEDGEEVGVVENPTELKVYNSCPEALNNVGAFTVFFLRIEE